jgi:hypothetical protein
VDPVPDPLLLRKVGSNGNRTRNLRICSQELWSLDHTEAVNNSHFILHLHTSKFWKFIFCQKAFKFSCTVVFLFLIISRMDILFPVFSSYLFTTLFQFCSSPFQVPLPFASADSLPDLRRRVSKFHVLLLDSLKLHASVRWYEDKSINRSQMEVQQL